MRPIVDVRHLDVCFGDFYAVRDVSFSVASGEIFGFLGANGAGKTTTIRVLCGLLRATGGRVFVNNTEFVAGAENIIKSHVGYMSQKFTLYNELSIYENFDFAAALRNIPREKYIKTRDKLLRFIGFDMKLNTIVKDLPGGIKQEIALCVALLHEPKIIFLDEPTAGVSPMARDRFWRLIRQLADTGKTVFVTTHYMDEAENCGRVALMRSGQLIALDSPQNLKKQTFGAGLLSFAPRVKNPILPPSDDMEMCEPFGVHWHIRFRDGLNENAQIKKYSRDFNITRIAPSLEDVFIKLVERG
ncbi:MAG: ABC transporter ATP-binding protein [Alphaproteobacteria bacterium]|nr:ABC transporter ATP-binding protein [Alphaproteobacteria bacterium]